MIRSLLALAFLALIALVLLDLATVTIDWRGLLG
jgi:hypothetical protein